MCGSAHKHSMTGRKKTGKTIFDGCRGHCCPVLAQTASTIIQFGDHHKGYGDTLPRASSPGCSVDLTSVTYRKKFSRFSDPEKDYMNRGVQIHFFSIREELHHVSSACGNEMLWKPSQTLTSMSGRMPQSTSTLKMRSDGHLWTPLSEPLSTLPSKTWRGELTTLVRD